MDQVKADAERIALQAYTAALDIWTKDLKQDEKLLLPVLSALVFVLLGGLFMLFSGSGKKKGPKAFMSKEDRSDKIVKLGSVESISHDTKRFRFDLPDNHVLGLHIGKHVKIKCPNPNYNKGQWNAAEDAEESKEIIERKYTPTSSDRDVGHFELVVKVYKKDVNDRFPDGGKMSQYLASLKVGDELTVSGPWGSNEYHGRGVFTRGKKEMHATHVGMLAGGTGITPMLQIIDHILNDKGDTTHVSLIFANQTEDDILVRDILEKHAAEHPDRFKLHYTLDRPPANWEYSTGFITDEMIKEHLPPPQDGTLILMCGPPPMIKFACKANLEKLGFTKDQQVEF